MKISTNMFNALCPSGSLLFRTSHLDDLKTSLRRKSVARTGQHSARNAELLGLLNRAWKTLSPDRTMRCNACLADIPRDSERCPYCSALQLNENARLRHRDAGWY